MKNLRFVRTFRFALSRYLVICAALICASDALGQNQADTPTGLAGGFGGSITTGGGSFDPYERNASRSVTDIVVPGAVVPFTFTRTWNSRSSPPQMAIGWRHNFQWDLEDIIAAESGDSDPNSIFKGYNVHYPDGRVVKFNKPSGAPVGAPGTYSPDPGIVDRFVIQPGGAQAQLFMSDGSVVNFNMYDIERGLTSIVDPHGLVVSFTYDSTGMTIKEPGQRWIHVGPEQLSIETNTNTCEVTTSLGQWVTYTMAYHTGGLYPYRPGDTGDPDRDEILTSQGTVTYHDVPDPDTGAPIEAHYVYKTVEPPSPVPNASPSPHNRLISASDPMFNGPLQQIKYVYVDNTSASNGDFYMSAVLEERWATNYWNPNEPHYHEPGVMISRVEMPPNTWASPEYFTRFESTGYGAVRTLSYFNSTLGHGQTLVDHFTDFTNDLTKVERHEYDWDHYFQTPTKITDARQKFTVQTLEPVLGHITRETHMDTSYRSWTYTDPAFPYYVGTKTDDLVNPTTYTRDPDTHRVTRIDHPGGSFETFGYNNFGQITEHRLPSTAVEYSYYDGRGLLQWEYNSVDGWDARKEYTYYQPGEPGGTPDLVKTMTDGRARAAGAPFSTRMTYNGRLQVTKVEYPDTGAPAPMPPPPSLRPTAPRPESPTPAPTPCQYCCDPRMGCAQIGPLD